MLPVAKMEENMMPVIRVNDATFADLSALKTWFGSKTPSDTIDRIVQEAMDQLGIERDKEPEDTITITNEGAMEFDSAPGLSFTKPLSASVGGKRILNPRWSSILISMITEVMTKGYEGKKLVSQLQVPARAERYEDDGFKYYPDLGISVQGQSASDAWKEIDRLANAFGVRVKVEFWWRRNPKAQFPGKTGILTAGKA
jgi:hypothetical protein